MRTIIVIGSAIVMFGTALAQNGGTALERFVTAIRSVDQVKQEIKSHMSETCGTGTCFNNNATAICASVGALDIRLNNLVSNTNPRFTPKPELPISPADLQLMKRIWGQCKASNYQYWNYGQVLHVIYDPAPQEDEAIRELLGIK